MVYNTENYWVFLLFLSSDILENRKHEFSETGSFSETPYFLLSRIPDDGKILHVSHFPICDASFIHSLIEMCGKILFPRDNS
jgi:hypothetical protein